MRKEYSTPKIAALGQHADLVAAGGATSDIDGIFYEDSEKFASFGTEPKEPPFS
jgi:hypothetical protein